LLAAREAYGPDRVPRTRKLRVRKVPKALTLALLGRAVPALAVPGLVRREQLRLAQVPKALNLRRR